MMDLPWLMTLKGRLHTEPQALGLKDDVALGYGHCCVPC